MIDQGTYRSSACPYECTRKITRHEVVPSNEANMLSGLGMLGEGFIYPGHEDDPGKGFSRFATSGEAPATMARLHALHMSHNVTIDQCDEIVRRHQLLAPHGVWLVDHEHEDGFASAERLGDCGLFLGARSSVDADIWRAFYQYARMVLRLGHVDTWIDDDIIERDRALVEREGVQRGHLQGVPLVVRVRPRRRGVQLPAQARREQHRHALHPAGHARREQGGLPAALAAASRAALVAARALAAARRDPLRALGHRDHERLQGARVGPAA